MTDTKTLMLTEFLLARVAEDEAGNHCFGEGEYSHCWKRSERIDAECAAKRALIELHCASQDLTLVTFITGGPDCATCGQYGDYGHETDWPCSTLKILASVYADHSDFLPEWRL